ncbi:MAG TPA: hypothetical protein VHB98_20525 [Chloroflexota bacterium]|nr:hypothetical protein [Chloroflexota bacterium]
MSHGRAALLMLIANAPGFRGTPVWAPLSLLLLSRSGAAWCRRVAAP